MYNYVIGAYKDEYLASVYNASDVLLAPSKGEGFGIPVIQAHATGCPTIVADFTAQSELGSAYKIPIDPLDGSLLTPQIAEQAQILPSQILEALEWAYANRGNIELRKQARHEGLRYDVNHREV